MGLWSCDEQVHISEGRKGLSSGTVWEAADLKEMEGDADRVAGRERSGEGLGETGVDQAESWAALTDAVGTRRLLKKLRTLLFSLYNSVPRAV